MQMHDIGMTSNLFTIGLEHWQHGRHSFLTPKISHEETFETLQNYNVYIEFPPYSTLRWKYNL
jgi:hypothetical protein